MGILAQKSLPKIMVTSPWDNAGDHKRRPVAKIPKFYLVTGWGQPLEHRTPVVSSSEKVRHNLGYYAIDCKLRTMCTI